MDHQSCKFIYPLQRFDVHFWLIPARLFMHGGHTNRVSDFAWNPNDPWVMVSAAEDNLIQCWKVSSAIVGKGGDDVPAEELEA